jgi:hypothetical protein
MLNYRMKGKSRTPTKIHTVFITKLKSKASLNFIKASFRMPKYIQESKNTTKTSLINVAATNVVLMRVKPNHMTVVENKFAINIVANIFLSFAFFRNHNKLIDSSINKNIVNTKGNVAISNPYLESCGNCVY